MAVAAGAGLVDYEHDAANGNEATAGVYPGGGSTTMAIGAHFALDYSRVSRVLKSAREEGKTCPAWTGKATSKDLPPCWILEEVRFAEARRRFGGRRRRPFDPGIIDAHRAVAIRAPWPGPGSLLADRALGRPAGAGDARVAQVCLVLQSQCLDDTEWDGERRTSALWGRCALWLHRPLSNRWATSLHDSHWMASNNAFNVRALVGLTAPTWAMRPLRWALKSGTPARF